MPNLNKVFAKKNVDDMTDAEKKEYYKRQQNEKSKKDQEEYEKKVSNLLECCKKFNHYLNYTYNDSDRWHLKFKEIFKEYLESKKLFSRTKSVLKDIYKNFQYYTAKKYLFVRGKYKGMEPCLSPSEKFEKLKFKPKKPDKYGYIKRSAIDDKDIAKYFNEILPETLRYTYNRQPLGERSGAFDQESNIKVYRNIYANPYKKPSYRNVGHSTLSDPFINSKKIVIPSNVGVIPERAFEHFEKLEELTISANVKTIQSYAFSRCDNLKRIVFDSSPTVDDCAFNLILPSKLEEITFLKAPPKFTKHAFGLLRLSYIKPFTIKVKRDFLNDAKLAIARIISDNINDKSDDGQKKIETILNSKKFTFKII